ncbi:unnamed protein product [Boreogadus saida]
MTWQRIRDRKHSDVHQLSSSITPTLISTTSPTHSQIDRSEPPAASEDNDGVKQPRSQRLGPASWNGGTRTAALVFLIGQNVLTQQRRTKAGASGTRVQRGGKRGADRAHKGLFCRESRPNNPLNPRQNIKPPSPADDRSFLDEVYLHASMIELPLELLTADTGLNSVRVNVDQSKRLKE